MAKREKVAAAIQKTELFEARSETDTLRLWENYREQANMWRALALFQIPATLALIVFSMMLWATRTIELKVPSKPLPGVYLAKDIPDTEFVETATEFVNLIATYQFAIARRQFDQAREMLVEPILQKFNDEMMDQELRAIESTSRSQMFFIDPNKVQIQRRSDREVRVRLIGERMKIIAGKELPTITTGFDITMTTIPRQKVNPYGIVITNVDYENKDK